MLIILTICLPMHLKADTIESPCMHGFEHGLLKNDGHRLSFSGVTLERLWIQSYIINSSLARIKYVPADCWLYVLASASDLDNASFAPTLSTSSELRWDLAAENLKEYGQKDKLTIYTRNQFSINSSTLGLRSSG